MSITKKDFDAGIKQHLLNAYSEYFTAVKAKEAAEEKIRQFNLALSLITERDKLNDDRNPE